LKNGQSGALLKPRGAIIRESEPCSSLSLEFMGVLNTRFKGKDPGRAALTEKSPVTLEKGKPSGGPGGSEGTLKKPAGMGGEEMLRVQIPRGKRKKPSISGGRKL